MDSIDFNTIIIVKPNKISIFGTNVYTNPQLFGNIILIKAKIEI